jgi:hypothetical protein
MERESWLWKNFWSQNKKVNETRLELRELIEKIHIKIRDDTMLKLRELINELDEDFNLYLESKKEGEEIFGWNRLSKEGLMLIRCDIEMLRENIRDLLFSDDLEMEAKAVKAWGVWWYEKVGRVIKYLNILEEDIKYELLLFQNYRNRDFIRENMKLIIEKDWSPRRKKRAEEILGEIRGFSLW